MKGGGGGEKMRVKEQERREEKGKKERRQDEHGGKHAMTVCVGGAASPLCLSAWLQTKGAFVGLLVS